MPFCYFRMVEVVVRVARHTEPLHDALRGNVLRGSHRHDLIPTQRRERVLQGTARAFGRVTISPVLGRETPANLESRREVRFERNLAQSYDAGEQARRRALRRPTNRSRARRARAGEGLPQIPLLRGYILRRRTPSRGDPGSSPPTGRYRSLANAAGTSGAFRWSQSRCGARRRGSHHIQTES